MLTDKYSNSIIFIGLLVFMLSACAGQPSNADIAEQCEQGLSAAYAEYEAAESKGFGGSVSMVKATSLLGAAEIQQEFGKYPNCVNKVERARYYIKQATKGEST
jgi:starvation-inducible outer membrane lipoprotein